MAVRLTEPARLPQSAAVGTRIWPVRYGVRISGDIVPPVGSFDPHERRSVRRLDAMPLRELANMLRYVLRAEATFTSGGLRRELRITISSGGLHAVEPLIVIRGRRRRVLRYDAACETLQILETVCECALEDLARRVAQIVPNAVGPTLVFVGDLGRLRAAYDEPESLLWRDAGALMQSMAGVATAYRLGFCPLGLHGSEILAAVFGEEAAGLLAVGVAVVGRPAST